MKMTYLLNLRCQEISILTLGRTTANLPNQFIQLLLVKNPLTLALQLIGGNLLQHGLVHDANTGRTTSKGRASRRARNGRGNLRRLLRKRLSDRELGRLDGLRHGVGVSVGMSLNRTCRAAGNGTRCGAGDRYAGGGDRTGTLLSSEVHSRRVGKRLVGRPLLLWGLMAL